MDTMKVANALPKEELNQLEQMIVSGINRYHREANRRIAEQVRYFVRLGYHIDELKQIVKRNAITTAYADYPEIKVQDLVTLSPTQLSGRRWQQRKYLFRQLFWRKEMELDLI